MQISMNDLYKEVHITLEDYARGVDRVMAETNEEAGIFAETELLWASPRRTGNYAESWRLETVETKRHKTELVVWNPKYYRLTHLLEKSHRIANKYGSYGKSKPQPHIRPTEEKTEKKWVEIFEEKVQRIRV